MMSIISGLIFGITLDTFLIIYGVDAYIFPDIISFSPIGMNLRQLCINGALSYGLSIATAYYVYSFSDQTERSSNRIKHVAFLILLSVASFLAIDLIQPGTISMMFTCGVLVISMSECIALICSQKGPLLVFLESKKIMALLQIWFVIILITVAYEITNYFFPFWEWLPGTYHSKLLIEAIIILFGYIPLFYPMLVFWQLLERR